MKCQPTLRDAILYFSEFEHCKALMTELRWTYGEVKCPRCGSERVSYLAKARVWKCYGKHQKPTFSLKTGTIFEDSPIGLEKWLPCAWLLINRKNGISSYEVARGLGVTQKTAWFMLHRIRLGMQDKFTGGTLGGEVEVDETYIGGKIRNMHKDRRERVKAGRKSGPIGKTVIQGLLQRGKFRFSVIGETANAIALDQTVREHIEPGAYIYTDEARAYFGLSNQYVHQFVNHAEEYVRGNWHTNGLEVSGRCLREDSEEPTSISSRSTCSARSMKRRFASIIGKLLTESASWLC